MGLDPTSTFRAKHRGALSWCLVKSSVSGIYYRGDSAGNVGTLDWLMVSCYIEFPVE